MAIFKCNSCGYEREVPNKLVGKRAKCPDCAQGVTIVDFIPPDAESFEELFESGVEADLDGTHRSTELVGDEEDSTKEIDLDTSEVTINLSDDEDIICDKCGHVVDGDHSEGRCERCGSVLPKAEAMPELTEDSVDVSDLADDAPPQVWESDFPGNEDSEMSSLDDAEDERTPWCLFEGSLALNLFSGVVSGLLAFFFAVAMSLLAASQEGVSGYLPYILSTALTGMAVGCIFYSLLSRIPFAMSGPGTVATTLLFLLLGSLYRDMAGLYSDEDILITIVAAILLTSLTAGAVMWFIGKLKAGELIRYIPIQIIGGVIGAVGVFVVIVAFDWMGHFTLDWGNILYALRDCILNLNAAQCMSSMGPSIVFGLILFVGLLRCKNSLFLLGLLLVASAAGYAAGIWGTNATVRSLAMPIPYLENGVPLLLVKVFKSGFGGVAWGVIKANVLYIGSLAALVVLTAMYRITKLELLHGREADLSEEYRALGITNIISGLCGGMPSAVSYGRSAGNLASGGRGPVSGIVAGLVCAVGLYFVDYVIPLIPRYVPEGLLLFAGLALISGWMFKARTAFTRRDDLWMLWVTFFMTLLLGMLVGIGFGVALALMVTVSRNSKGGAVRNILSGANHRSNVDRAPAQQRTLKEYGDHIHILRLQGFLFLGSMGSLLKNIQTRLDDRNLLPVEYLILDFKMVTGLASAAGIGFDKLQKIVEEYDLELIITSAPLELEEHLEQSGHLGEQEGAFKVFFNLDYALEWCENHVLDSENMLHMKQMKLPELLAPVFPEPKYIPALMKVLKRVTAAKGETVFRQGDASDSMYFVESGRLDVELELEGGKVLRLKKVGPGAVFGEMGIYTMAPRTATIRAAEKCVLYMMSTEKLAAVEKRAPMLVTTIHRFMINMLSGRLADANIKVRDLMS